MCHFWNIKKDFYPALKLFFITKQMAVMTFMFTAFLLTGQSIISADKAKIRRRLHRLWVMHIAWAVIYFLFLMASAFTANKGHFAGKSITDMFTALAAQIVFGHSINPVMWFQVDLMLLTVIFAALYSSLRNRTVLAVICFAVVFAFFMQYSGINFMLFGEMGYTMKYTLGRVCEMIPPACAGIIFAKYGLMNSIQRHRALSIALCVAVLALTIIYAEFIPDAPSFGYSGLYLNLSSILLTVIFCLLPMHSLPVWIKHCIGVISQFSPGVYCTHVLVELCLHPLRNYVTISNSFTYCIVIFMVCLMLSFMISKIFGRMGRSIVS